MDSMDFSDLKKKIILKKNPGSQAQNDARQDAEGNYNL